MKKKRRQKFFFNKRNKKWEFQEETEMCFFLFFCLFLFFWPPHKKAPRWRPPHKKRQNGGLRGWPFSARVVFLFFSFLSFFFLEKNILTKKITKRSVPLPVPLVRPNKTVPFHFSSWTFSSWKGKIKIERQYCETFDPVITRFRGLYWILTRFIRFFYGVYLVLLGLT